MCHGEAGKASNGGLVTFVPDLVEQDGLFNKGDTVSPVYTGQSCAWKWYPASCVGASSKRNTSPPFARGHCSSALDSSTGRLVYIN